MCRFNVHRPNIPFVARCPKSVLLAGIPEIVLEG